MKRTKKVSKREMNLIIAKAGRVNRFYSRWTEVDKKNGKEAVFFDANYNLLVIVKNTKEGVWCSFKSANHEMCKYCTYEEAMSFLNIAMLHA